MISVSVIIPTHIHKEKTAAILESVFNSKGIGSEFELEVIIADSTPDDSLKSFIDERFGSKVVITRPLKIGIASSKNQGARVAQGDILIFFDVDIEFEEFSLLETIRAFQSKPTASLVTGQVLWKGGEKNGLFKHPGPQDRLKTIDDITYIETVYSSFCGTYKRIFDEVGGFDEVVFNTSGEGSDLSTRYWRAGYPLVYSSSIVVHFMMHENNKLSEALELQSAKDILLLAYKYHMLEGSHDNFGKTITEVYEQFGKNGYYTFLSGILKNLDVIFEAKENIDLQKETEKSLYDFKFLEVFSDEKKFGECIMKAQERLEQVKNSLHW